MPCRGRDVYKRQSYDCIISRGGTAALIRQVTDLPVVDIHISVCDVLRTMKPVSYTHLDVYKRQVLRGIWP